MVRASSCRLESSEEESREWYATAEVRVLVYHVSHKGVNTETEGAGDEGAGGRRVVGAGKSRMKLCGGSLLETRLCEPNASVPADV